LPQLYSLLVLKLLNSTESTITNMRKKLKHQRKIDLPNMKLMRMMKNYLN